MKENTWQKNAWYICGKSRKEYTIPQCPKSISKVHRAIPQMNCPFLIMPICRLTVTHQKRTKWKVNGSAYFNKIDRFIELHFIRGELFMEFCRDSCEETEELGSDLCLWCCNDRWLRPPTGESLNPLILRITVTTGMFLSARTYDERRA